MTSLLRTTTEILEKLIGFDTVSRNSNLALIEWIAHHLAAQDITATVLKSPDGTKANLFASIGPKRDGGIVLSGHTDVVPIDGQIWQRDPFRLTPENGRYYGRGSTDMKGYIACVLALVPQLLQAPLRRPVHFAFSYDEEVGCLGAHGLVDHIKAAGIRPDMAFIGEPTRMQVVNGHKGSCGMLTSITGRSCHSSRTDLGANAIYAAMDVVAVLRRRAEALEADPSDTMFDPPYTTVSVGVLNSGTARNAVPGDATIQWDIRATRPGMLDPIRQEIDAEVRGRILPALRARYAGAEIATETVYDVPPLTPEPDAEAEVLAKRLAGTNDATTAPYGSEAGIFQQAGMPTVICGPGDIAQAHIADEWIEVSEIEACLGFLERLVKHESAR
jgi:acetylornithine deacetylase